jgi:HSP20 family protein
MVLQRWDPFREFRPFHDIRRVEATIDRFRRGVSPRYTSATSQPDVTQQPNAWAIPLDVVRDGDNFVAQASLPGVRPEDISVTIDDNVLTISAHTFAETHAETTAETTGETEAPAGEPGEGDTTPEPRTYLLRERRTGALQRSLRLPDSVDAEKAETVYDAGVLTITLPKLEAKKAKQLTVAIPGN